MTPEGKDSRGHTDSDDFKQAKGPASEERGISLSLSLQPVFTPNWTEFALVFYTSFMLCLEHPCVLKVLLKTEQILN